jgi:outer membrane protein TolC
MNYSKTFRLSVALCLCAGVAPAQKSALAPAGAGRPLSFQNSARLHDLMRAGGLYLSLEDAIALAIENNLDIELQRYALPGADAELLRAQGGGIIRGLNFTLAEAPAGVGGPLSPVVTAAASSGLATTGSTVSSNALELGALNEAQTSLTLAGTTGSSNGTAVPLYDPLVTGQLNWTHQTTQQLSVTTEGRPALVTNTTLGNAGIQQGFASGAVASLNFDNARQSLNAFTSQYNAYTGSSLGVNITQPLLRGFGASLNRRYIRIAGNEQRIASLLFRQQLIATVYGVIRLYTDYVALSEDEKVKRETLASAEKLYADVKAQVDQGTLAPVELARANAQVYSVRQDLINATGLREEEEAILKNVLTRTGNEDPLLRDAQVIATDPLVIPASEETRPIQDLIQDALANRPDLGQGRLQIENLRAGLEGSKSATKPELDLVGVMQNNGLAGSLNPATTVIAPAAYVAGYGGALNQILTRKDPTYGVGVQLTLPVHNRIAEADLARDELQEKQSEIRLRQLENQARLEVEDALIAMRRARTSYEAATEARKLQEESLAAERAKFEVGASTAFFVIQYESLLAQARSTEVAAESSYVKAKAALARATGSILDENRISVEGAAQGKAR